jgi:hypothetical protein
MEKVRAIPTTREKRLTRLQVMLSVDELVALDNFRFQKRMPSRAAAIREILRRGLTVNGFALAAQGLSSGEFGVLESNSAVARSPTPGGAQVKEPGVASAQYKGR